MTYNTDIIYIFYINCGDSIVDNESCMYFTDFSIPIWRFFENIFFNARMDTEILNIINSVCRFRPDTRLVW